MNKKIATLALTSLSALTLASCGLLNQATNPATPASSSAPAAASSSSAAAASSAVTAAAVTVDQAKATVFESLGITEADVMNLVVQEETEDGKPVYEIDFDHNGMEHSYTVDAVSGAMVERDSEMDDDAAATSAAAGSSSAADTNASSSTAAAGTSAAAGTLTADDAKMIAVNDFAEVYGTTEADLVNLMVNQDTDNGVSIFEVDFNYGGYEHAYDINADSGEIISYNIDFE